MPLNERKMVIGGADGDPRFTRSPLPKRVEWATIGVSIPLYDRVDDAGRESGYDFARALVHIQQNYPDVWQVLANAGAQIVTQDRPPKEPETTGKSMVDAWDAGMKIRRRDLERTPTTKTLELLCAIERNKVGFLERIATSLERGTGGSSVCDRCGGTGIDPANTQRKVACMACAGPSRSMIPKRTSVKKCDACAGSGKAMVEGHVLPCILCDGVGHYLE